jgi:hypothetical protein
VFQADWGPVGGNVNTNSKSKEDDFTDSDAVVCFKTCEFFSAHMSPSPFRSLPPSHLLYTSLPALSQPETLKTITTLSQPWLLHDVDSDTELAADTAYI